MDKAIIRKHLISLLQWEDAHVNFDTVINGIPEELRGVQARGLPYSPWQLLEHLRTIQHDILDFCQNPNYKEPTWPDDYWPQFVAPRSLDEWENSIKLYRSDRKALLEMAANPEVDLTAPIPHGSGQNYFRELLLVADHNSYHIGQLVIVRRLLGIWK
ncbi:DinB family protein [Echinicola jeungdonensis]|uniref:DinB family protein n=1 Tax=Echinicola jeungdonensis TaxID=709343 RepID=A0ABV5J8C6_9BACT|nr:DinB family protein [Echinicola jeungdonensis]MDN3669479.1 DinB family protein [Echinicola jeungdonensis]